MQLKKNSVEAVEERLGADLSDEQVKKIVESIKEKVNLDDMVDEVKDKIGGFFHKEGDGK